MNGQFTTEGDKVFAEEFELSFKAFLKFDIMTLESKSCLYCLDINKFRFSSKMYKADAIIYWNWGNDVSFNNLLCEWN